MSEAKFNVGDRVRKVNKGTSANSRPVGYEFTVADVTGPFTPYRSPEETFIYWEEKDHKTINVSYEEELELVEPKFKVGDRVRVVSRRDGSNNDLVGSEFTVSQTPQRSAWYPGDFFFRGAGSGIYESEVELVPFYPEQKFQVGDFVRYKNSVGYRDEEFTILSTKLSKFGVWYQGDPYNGAYADNLTLVRSAGDRKVGDIVEITETIVRRGTVNNVGPGYFDYTDETHTDRLVRSNDKTLAVKLIKEAPPAKVWKNGTVIQLGPQTKALYSFYDGKWTNLAFGGRYTSEEVFAVYNGTYTVISEPKE